VPRSRRLLGALSDERLVEQVRRGSDVAFEVLYDRHSRAILSFCRHMLGNPDEAEDAVQHTFIAAYNDLLASHRPIKLKAWLYTIARNRCLSVLRTRRESPVETIEVSTAGLAEQVQERQDLRELLADLRRLPDEQRAALVLAEIGDLAHADIGEVLGVEPAKVKSLVFQARSNLIELRDARAIPCAEIREQLSTLRGGALRRGPLRKHLKACEGCREFRDEVNRQRAAMAAVLPVLPTLGLKHSALAAVGGGVGGGGAAAAAGGGLLTGAGSAGVAAKAVAVLAVGGAAVGGGVAISNHASGPPSSPPGSVEQGTAHRSAVGAEHAQGPPGSTAAAPGIQSLTAHLPRGVARRVRAYGSPPAKHHGNTSSQGLAIGHGHAPSAKGHSRTHSGAGSQGNHGTNGNHGSGGNSSSGGGKQTHTPNSHSEQTGGKSQSTAANGHQGTPQGQSTSTTPAIAAPSLPGTRGSSGNLHEPNVKPPKGPSVP
jgi:RNA polymerase sigma factor (sigma-70 family)